MGEARAICSRRGFRAGLTEDEQDDLLQDVLEKYFRAWPPPAAPDNPAAWLETATAHAVVDRFRAAARRPVAPFAPGGSDAVSIVVSAMRSTRFASLPAVSEALLRDIFELIPTDDAELLRSRNVDGRSAAMLAEERSISIANVDQRTTRARHRLQEALAARPDLVAELRAPHPHVY